MSEQKKYQLISGVFNSKEALSIVMSFYNYKINYHNIQLLTAIEHNDNTVSIIEQKIKDLRKTSEEVRNLLTNEITWDHQVEVTGYVEINLNPVTNV